MDGTCPRPAQVRKRNVQGPPDISRCNDERENAGSKQQSRSSVQPASWPTSIPDCRGFPGVRVGGNGVGVEVLDVDVVDRHTIMGAMHRDGDVRLWRRPPRKSTTTPGHPEATLAQTTEREKTNLERPI